MNQIEFIPLIEPATKKDKESQIIPGGNPFNNTSEWDVYQKRELGKSYSNFPDPISKGFYQYKLFDIGIDDMESLISLHVGDMDVNESISLFGGYAISKNGVIELYPQCCGLLEEVQLWKNILQEDFQDFYLAEGHPSPLITKRGGEIIIYCKDDVEAFVPAATRQEIRLDYNETKTAFMSMLNDLTNYSTELNKISKKFETENIADIMIWGRKMNGNNLSPGKVHKAIRPC